MLKRLLLSAGILTALLLGGELFTTSCASRSAPGGGPKDTLAPSLDTSFPANFTTNFEVKKITLIFDEYISLKSPGQQISFSPPLQKKPEVVQRGKEVEISWKDTLLESTTYTISFGSAITDFTEGNVNDNFKYVFSTGDFIDSLSVAGQVMNGKTGAAQPEMLVGLYDLTTLKKPDSIPYRQLPTYYTYTGEDGRFELENLKYGQFYVVAFEDNRKNFQLNSGTEKIAFLSDTLNLTDSTKEIKLVSFDPVPPPRFYGARHSSKGKILLPFNYPVPGLSATPMHADSLHFFLQQPENSDTAFFWFDDTGLDSLVLLISSDTAVIDTSHIFLRKYNAPTLNLTLVNQKLKSGEPVELRTNLPLDSVDTTGIVFFSPKDTLAPASINFKNPLVLQVVPQKRYPEYFLYLKKGSLHSLAGPVNDSLEFTVNSLKREDLGNLDFVVETDSSRSLVLVIYDPEKKEILRRAFRGKTTVNLKSQRPGVYDMQLIIDQNGDGRWTTGDYLEGRQPERILQYRDKAEVRANWDVELIWQPDFDQRPVPVISKKSRSAKN